MIRKPSLCLEARCLFLDSEAGDGSTPAKAALRFIARSVGRFHVTVWSPGPAHAVKDRVCQGMVEELGRQQGYGLASLVRFTQEPPKNALLVTAERLARAGSWRSMEVELAEPRPRRPRRAAAVGLLGSLASSLLLAFI